VVKFLLSEGRPAVVCGFIGAYSVDIMSEDSNEDDFSINEWMSLNGITDAGVKKLETCQINDLRTLLLIGDAEIEQLKLNIGDSLRFKAGIKKLHDLKDTPPELVDQEGIVRKGGKESVKPQKDRLYTQLEVE
jgi:hypothetical protein